MCLFCISIGSLGKSGDGLQVKGVQNVTAKSVMFANTQNGFRIKTWGTNARGYVKGVAFVNALMRNVQNPIIIDQNYCPGNQNCPGQVYIASNFNCSKCINSFDSNWQ